MIFNRNGPQRRRHLRIWLAIAALVLPVAAVLALPSVAWQQSAPSSGGPAAVPTAPPGTVPVIQTPVATRAAPVTVAHTPNPVPRRAKPTPTASTCGAPPNPYGLNFCGHGHLVTSPPAGVCGIFPCILNFANGRGFMVRCNDGKYSMSGGLKGRCSDHGGGGKPVTQG